FDPQGREVVFQGALDPHTPVGQGWLRASHRKLDAELSRAYRPWHAHDEKQPLTPGAAVELDIEIWPTCIVVPAGYRVALTLRGNTTDIMTRLIGPKMSERLGQQIVVENRPGASGMLGLDLVAKSAPDGYTLAAGQGGNMVVLPHTSRNIPYDPLKDFVPIAVTTTNYLGIVANPGAPFKSIGEMVAYARANPGRLTVATNGEGGFPHLAFEHLRALGGFTFTHVPYKGSA